MATIPALVDQYEDVFDSMTIIGSAARQFEAEYRTFGDLLKISALEEFGDKIPGYLRKEDLEEVKSFIQEYFKAGEPDFSLGELKVKQKDWFDAYTKTYYP